MPARLGAVTASAHWPYVTTVPSETYVKLWRRQMTVNAIPTYLTRPQIADLTGLSRQVVHYWDKKGYLKPVGRVGLSGTRLYTPADVLAHLRRSAANPRTSTKQVPAHAIAYLEEAVDNT